MYKRQPDAPSIKKTAMKVPDNAEETAAKVSDDTVTAALEASKEAEKKSKEQASKASADASKSVNSTDGGASGMQVALLQEQNELLRGLLRTTKSNTSDMYSSA